MFDTFGHRHAESNRLENQRLIVEGDLSKVLSRLSKTGTGTSASKLVADLQQETEQRLEQIEDVRVINAPNNPNPNPNPNPRKK